MYFRGGNIQNQLSLDLNDIFNRSLKGALDIFKNRDLDKKVEITARYLPDINECLGIFNDVHEPLQELKGINSIRRLNLMAPEIIDDTISFMEQGPEEILSTYLQIFDKISHEDRILLGKLAMYSLKIVDRISETVERTKYTDIPAEKIAELRAKFEKHSKTINKGIIEN